MIILNVIGGLLIGTSVGFTNPDEPVEIRVTNKASWKLVDQDEKITIYERWVSLDNGGKTRERKGVFCVDTEVSEVVPFVSGAEGIKNWMHGVEESKELNINGDSSKFVYLFFDAPWPFRNRDLVTKITTIQKCDSPCIDVFLSAIGNYLPKKENVIRLQSYEAHWQIIETDAGKTQITFRALSDTPPVAPKWIQDPVTAKIFKENLLNLMELLTIKN